MAFKGPARFGAYIKSPACHTHTHNIWKLLKKKKKRAKIVFLFSFVTPLSISYSQSVLQKTGLVWVWVIFHCHSEKLKQAVWSTFPSRKPSKRKREVLYEGYAPGKFWIQNRVGLAVKWREEAKYTPSRRSRLPNNSQWWVTRYTVKGSSGMTGMEVLSGQKSHL